MKKSLTIVTTAVLTLLGLMVAIGPPASADTWSRGDARRDVAQVKFTKTDFGLQRAPRNRTTDLTRLTVSHQAQTISMRIRVRNLTETEGRSIIAILRTPQGLRAVMVETSTSSFVFKQPAIAAKRLGNCPRLRKEFNYAANVIRIVVPRRCLGNPQWVRVGLQMSTIDNNFRTLAIDDALTGRLRMRDLNGLPDVSRKIRR